MFALKDLSVGLLSDGCLTAVLFVEEYRGERIYEGEFSK